MRAAGMVKSCLWSHAGSGSQEKTLVAVGQQVLEADAEGVEGDGRGHGG
jgi:hypothetical protein